MCVSSAGGVWWCVSVFLVWAGECAIHSGSVHMRCVVGVLCVGLSCCVCVFDGRCDITIIASFVESVVIGSSVGRGCY